jgi:beta-xylosidase
MHRSATLVQAGVMLATSLLSAACSSSDPTTPFNDAGTPVADSSLPQTTADAGGEDARGGDAVSTVQQPDAADSAVPDEDTGAPPARDAGEDAAPAAYLNPVINADFPDPFILRAGTTYYAFATNAGAENIQAASSTDLAHWTILPDALPMLPSWAQSGSGLTWAPSVLQLGPATFVMYYTARDTASGFQCVSHAEASSPAGPYVDATASAFVCQVSAPTSFCGSIDPSPFVDTNGDLYLLWKSDENSAACSDPPRLWSALLSADGLSVAGPATELLIMDQAWQQPIIEAPTMTVVAGTYYLAYSANNYESAAYSMGYATCLSATGPCENVSVSGPFISSAGTALGPGGGSFFEDTEGDLWLAYHAWTAPITTYAGGGARSLRIDRMGIGDAGLLVLEGPTTSPQAL